MLRDIVFGFALLVDIWAVLVALIAWCAHQWPHGLEIVPRVFQGVI